MVELANKKVGYERMSEALALEEDSPTAPRGSSLAEGPLSMSMEYSLGWKMTWNGPRLRKQMEQSTAILWSGSVTTLATLLRLLRRKEE